MRLMQTCLVIALVAASAIVAHAQRAGAARTQSSKTYTSIRQVDFNNFIYRLPLPSGRAIRLTGGVNRRVVGLVEEGLEFQVERGAIVYGDLTDDGTDEAAMSLSFRDLNGGAVLETICFAYTLRN